MTKGLGQYYLELFLWLIVLNIPAVIILLIGTFSEKKEKAIDKQIKKIRRKSSKDKKEREKK